MNRKTSVFLLWSVYVAAILLVCFANIDFLIADAVFGIVDIAAIYAAILAPSAIAATLFIGLFASLPIDRLRFVFAFGFATAIVLEFALLADELKWALIGGFVSRYFGAFGNLAITGIFGISVFFIHAVARRSQTAA